MFSLGGLGKGTKEIVILYKVYCIVDCLTVSYDIRKSRYSNMRD